MTESAASAPAEAPYRPEDGWHRSGGLVYALSQVGWRRGEPQMANSVTVNVQVDARYAPPAVIEEIAERIRKMLDTEYPALGEPAP